MIFAKVFNVREGQVLVVREWDTEHEMASLKVSTHLDGVFPSMSGVYETEEQRDSVFEDYNEEMAQEFYDSMVAQFS